MIINTEEILTTEQLCSATGVRSSLLLQWVYRGKITPKYILGGTINLWGKDQVDEVRFVKENSRSGRPQRSREYAY